MERSEWISIIGIAVGLLAVIIGNGMYLSFQVGRISQRLTSLEKIVELLASKVDNLIVDVAELKVKVDILWRDRQKVDDLWRDRIKKKKLNKP